MRRNRAVLLGALLLILAGGGASALYWGLRQVPEFYEAAIEQQPAPEQRKEAAKKFVQRTLHLVEGIQHDDRWAEEFTQEQVNSWLAEELQPKYGQLVPEGVDEPRIRLAEESVEVGFHYAHDSFNGVVSVRARPWVPQPNQLAFEILSIRAGLVPIPLERILHELSEQFKTEGWLVEWAAHDGNDVVIFHLDNGREERPVLEAVEVAEGKIRISGRRDGSSESSGNAPGPITTTVRGLKERTATE